ncbi:MAG: Glycosyl transferase group 1 [Candidatus Daviesbacteria bacterium GW2011_GWA1_41_61]|nr:MAG: glycosyl transferase, group 1 [Candidatus Daviesbacteria bacterium GW2011_GWC1_40_9]KKR93004.1 MAG: Glycosyl transferase group 1 [Candidatus Daviesbacteria bacterium GW2011_GWB1_41_15]KKS15548.1 MAG: Glycosyl transferase group 1 [Candidatus Daviesbacteria bacterium GW2011_GWA1_41_61]
MIKVAFNISPLSSGHKTRGIGVYARNLMEHLQKRSEVVIEEFSDISEVKDADLVHFPFWDLFQRSLPLKNKFPTIVTIHDAIPLIFSQHYPPGIKGKINNFWQRQALRDVKAVITDSRSSKQDISKYLHVPLNKIFPIPLAPAADFQPVKDLKKLDQVRKKYNLPQKFVIFVGSVNWNKNLVGLTQASLEAGIEVFLVGKDFEDKSNLDHPERRSYAQFLEKFGDHPKVHLLGFVPTDDLVALINLAQVLLLPSYYEGFGLPILEAQSCGVPVITSKTSSMSEVAGEGAVLVDPYKVGEIAQAIDSILKNDKLRRDLVKKGEENVKRFTWEKTVSETINVYQQVVN